MNLGSDIKGDDSLKMLTNRVLKTIFGPMRVEVTGGRRNLHIGELRVFYTSSTIRTIKSSRMRRAGHVARIRKKRNSYRILMGKSEGKRSVRRRRWEDNIKLDLKEIGYGDMVRIVVALDRDQRRALVNTVMNLLILQNIGNFLSSCTPVGFSRTAQLHSVSVY
jgi:DNA-binding transcriptional regulator PaaX